MQPISIPPDGGERASGGDGHADGFPSIAGATAPPTPAWARAGEWGDLHYQGVAVAAEGAGGVGGGGGGGGDPASITVSEDHRACSGRYSQAS